MASTLPGYAYSYFLPVILKQGMGYSTAQSQLLSAPPYVLAAIMTFTSGWLGDRYHIRGPLIAVHQLLTAVGMLITAYGGSNAARYFGAFLGIGFLQYCIPGVITFQASKSSFILGGENAVADQNQITSLHTRSEPWLLPLV